MKTLAKITNADVTQITKVSMHVKTSGWGNLYFVVLMLFHRTMEAFDVKSMAKTYNKVRL